MATVIYLDTETNGPLPKRKPRTPPYTDTAAWPRLVQLSFCVARLTPDGGDGGVATRVLQRFTAYVDPGPTHTWCAESEAFNGISQADVAGGVQSSHAMAQLVLSMRAWRVQHVIAHNLPGFDAPVLQAEAVRCGLDADTLWGGAELLCTMLGLAGWNGGRWPRLGDAYQKLHGKPWDGAALHDAEADVACLMAVHAAAVRARLLGPALPPPSTSDATENAKGGVESLGTESAPPPSKRPRMEAAAHA